MLPLFDEPPDSGFDKRALARKLQSLSGQGIHIGTSSWKYEGWLGQIYDRERYITRGRFSQKRFEQECLNEFAETFPIVCGDFTFYQFPSEQSWSKLFASAPRSLQYAFKVPEEITVKTFPQHPRYGARANMDNPGFLNADLFHAAFTQLLEPYRRQTAVLIFEFGAFSRRAMPDAESFAAVLDPFLAKLPPDFRYAVEIRNPDFLAPDYFAVLKQHNVAHVFNAWSKMPELATQMSLKDSFTADFTVVRALLRHGRVYDDAVDKFAPYEIIQDENPPARQALQSLIERAKAKKEPSFIFVNNRLEGNAPKTIEAVVSDE